MPNQIDSLEAEIEVSLKRLTELSEIEGRKLTDDESAEFDGLLIEVRGSSNRVATFREAEAETKKSVEERKSRFDESLNTRTKAGASVTSEPAVYSQEAESRGTSFLSDAYRSQFMGDFGAQDRINRYRKVDMEHRDIGTPAAGALIPPQYLVDLYAPLARAGRPTANTVGHAPLPESGMVLNVPRLTTGSGVAVQATENSAVQETDIDETTLVIPVATLAGQQDVSRQALERGHGIDTIVFGDLSTEYAVQLDRQVISGTGSSGQMLGILNTPGISTVAYTDATPTVPEFYPKLQDAVQRVNSLRFLPASAIIMHPRRWGWYQAALDAGLRPFAVPGSNGPFNAHAVGEAAKYGQVVGELGGLPVITDANIPTNLGAGTNEDVVIVARVSDLLLFEGPGDGPMHLKFEQTLGGSLTVKLVVYDYAAFTAGRYPASTSLISGTGLVTPTF